MWIFWEIILWLYCGLQTLLYYLLFLMEASELGSRGVWERGYGSRGASKLGDGGGGARILVTTSVRTATLDWLKKLNFLSIA
jgi:hypothetical protein